MPEDVKLTKAQKLAAARKKLKEYQQRNQDATATIANNTATNAAASGTAAALTEDNSSTLSTASNLSERSESELNLNGHTQPSHSRQASGSDVAVAIAAPITECNNTASSYFATAGSELANFFTSNEPQQFLPAAMQQSQPQHIPEAAHTHDANLNTIQVLITEKSQLNAELTKLRNVCREHELDLEELRVLHNGSQQRVEELQAEYSEQQRNVEQLRKTNAELQHKIAQSSAKTEDQQAHIDELEHQLKLQGVRINELEQQLLQKSNELELAMLRIRQLSDETNITADNRVETLTQTQYMHEQQIRDLQAMVQQLTQDKEQANMQYQTYAQHLNSEITKLNERNAEMSEENAHQSERERQLVAHVSSLEREIQKNIQLQEQFKAAHEPTDTTKSDIDDATVTNELTELKERLADNDFERHEYQLKIKSLDDQLQAAHTEMSAQAEALDELEEKLAQLQAEQPDQSKLLATMESDKIAASRALTQNIELKKQLDELELRFVQLTNDKAELMNKLDTEEFTKRELRTNYDAMVEKLNIIDERFKFKDEEMIRLSHENMEITRKNLVLEQQLDRLKHYEVKDYHKNYSQKTIEEHLKEEECLDEANKQHCTHEHQHANEHVETQHEHDSCHELEHTPLLNVNDDDGIEATEAVFTTDVTVPQHTHNKPNIEQQSHVYANESSSQLPTAEAVEKLQSRFTQLMSQIADLTEEKHRLEHLVLQLQSETETIGEYVALYQTQRRMLKQREYEKAAQMKLLETEREQLREKITILNNLVTSLGVELPKNNRLVVEYTDENMPLHVETSDTDTPTSRTATTSASTSTEEAIVVCNEAAVHTPSGPEVQGSQDILYKIQNIITEIKADTEQELPMVQHTVDHLNCCLGKVEIV